MKNIVRVPSYRKIKKYKPLHESIFDMDDDNDILSNELSSNNDLQSNYSLEQLEKLYASDIARIDKICDYYGISNYTYNFANDGVSIDVDGDLNLSNNKWSRLPINIRKVTGNFDISLNRLTDMSSLPRFIGGWCNVSRNRLVDFTGVPECKKLYAEKLYVKTKYPLTDENYKKYLDGTLMESMVYIKRLDAYGEIKSLTSTGKYCNVKLYEADGIHTFKVKDIDYLLD